MMLGPATAARVVLKREFARVLRRRSQLVLPLLFYVIVVNLFPMAIGPDAPALARFAPAIVWVAVLLATTLTLDDIFRSDFEDGSLEQLVLSVQPLPLLLAAKVLAHWVTSAAPLILMSVPLALMLGANGATTFALITALLLGTPVLSLVGTVASALTVGLRGGAVLLALIILPLYIPVMIFGTAAARNASLGLPVAAELYFLAGLAVLALTLAPGAAAAALRVRLG